MRPEPNTRLDKWRHCPRGWESPAGVNYGAFRVRVGAVTLSVLSSGSDSVTGWEHVSVSLPLRTPTWEEMSQVKRLFWGDNECVLQFHVPKSRHVNFHFYCLHLWKPLRQEIELPPTELVGPLTVR